MFRPVYYEPSNTTAEELAVFGVKVREIQRDPQFKFALGRLWKSAASVFLYDDGRVVLTLHSHLNERERHQIYGIGQTVFRDGVAHCKRQEFTRLRKSKKRPVACWWQFVWVAVSRADSLYDSIFWSAYGHHPDQIRSIDSEDERLHQQHSAEGATQ
ncbi:hypothetical protein [Gordonia lacunae]|uniref:Uncharacterized protein n=1 Tax=Gordonia lacunae TaxID=417102 RepID=A0A243Q6Z6_9ACTN|nr:hypothetical protein [Gordonia lacunae]OUC77281.1 hypothetical protein CA982_17805 [Gordonia lacunae]